MEADYGFRSEEVIEEDDLPLTTDLNDDRLTTIERIVPIRTAVSAFVCSDCGASWYRTGEKTMADARAHFETHREQYAPDCGDR
jgi:predicted RNA-binding Zn-ribbon protein involved in translation (DUF1610 family)